MKEKEGDGRQEEGGLKSSTLCTGVGQNLRTAGIRYRLGFEGKNGMTSI